ncbi:MAG: hypothetical protein KDD58_05300 [Bdellovibrionales bacterium]|nr:hypothetical protein [Bdellovibrionales bacterium]
MFFKEFKFFSLIFVLTSLSACSLKIGESPRRPLNIANKEMECVRELGEGMNKYLEASLSENEIYDWATCVNDAIYNFDKFTIGENPNYYTKDEISKTLSEVVFPDNPISINLVSSALVLKSYLVGGSVDHVSREELRRLQDLIWTVEDSAIILNPHIPVINQLVLHKPEFKQLVDAKHVLERAIINVLAATKNYRKEIDFESINNFLVEFQKFSQGDTQKATAFTNLAEKFYNIIMGQPHDNRKIHKEHNEIFYSELVYWYSIRLYYIYKLKDAKLLEGEGLDSTKYFIDEILSGIKRVINRYEQKAAISYEHMEDLVDAFSQANLLPPPFRAESIKSALHPFFDKVFGDSSVEFDKRASQGLDREIVAQMEAEFYKWYELQNLLVQEFKKWNQPFDLIQFVNENLWSNFISSVPETASHYIEMKSLWQNTPLRYKWGSGRIVVAPKEQVSEMRAERNFYQLSLVNIIATAVRLVARSYPQDLSRAQKLLGLTELDLDRFISDFKLIWQDLNVMPPTAKNVGKRMFTESNLFTISGNGINEPTEDEPTAHLLTLQEGVELISLLYSSYSINKSISEKYEQTCYQGPKDVFGKEKYLSNCFWQNFGQFYGPEFNEIPGIKSFMLSLNPNSTLEQNQDEWEDFKVSMDKLIRYDCESAEWMGSIQMGKATMLLHYIQLTIHKFDEDENGFIDVNEGIKSYPHFRGVLDRVTRERGYNFDDDELFNTFVRILKYAKVPNSELEAAWDDISKTKIERLGPLQILKIFRGILVAKPEDIESCVDEHDNNDVIDEIIENVEREPKYIKRKMNRLRDNF